MEILKDKKLLVGGLAVIGGIALVSYLLKPKAPSRNSEGFFGASGRMSRVSSGGNCEVCYDNYSTNNSYQSLYYAQNGYCRKGDRCKRSLKAIQA